MNRGDIALVSNNTTQNDRREIVNGDAFAMNIFAGEVFAKDSPDEDFNFYWWYQGNNNTCRTDLSRAKAKGFEFVTKDKFESARFDWNADGKLEQDGHVLMFRPKERFFADQKARQDDAQARLSGQREQFHALAEQAGVGTLEAAGDDEFRTVVRERKSRR